MDTPNRRAFRLHACATCGGDAYLDLTDSPEWRCLQCGRPIFGNPAVVTPALRIRAPKAA
jgi:DNA-directed RNA polymerase subunit RPC12/RpoP